MVFELSAEINGTSINKELLSGPGLTNQIVRVLLSFSDEEIAVTGHIEALYHQVKVQENQRCFPWFLGGETVTPAKLLLIMK